MANKEPGANKLDAQKQRGRKMAPKIRNRHKGQPTNAGPTEPSRPTVKRLFAVSGNRCAFSRCKSHIVDPDSGSIIGEICHIKGDKPGKGEKASAKRYDPSQPNKERHGFGNLILLCGTHHKVIDDDDKTYTVERLLGMKRKHEDGQPNGPRLTNTQADQLIANIRGNSLKDGSIIQTQHQSGGQNAHVMNIYNGPPPEDDSVVVEGFLRIIGDADLLQRFGCPGLQLTVVCQSKRPAKFSKAILSVEGRGFLAALQGGWDVPFGHNPPEDLETETLNIDFTPLSQPNSPEGHSLNRDDVCQFYLPMFGGPLGIFLDAQPDDVSVRLVFLDDSERIILCGEKVQGTIRALIEAHGRGPYCLKTHATVTVNVKSATPPPDLWPIVGTTNANAVSFAPVGQAQQRAAQSPVQVGIGFVDANATHEFTLGVLVANTGPRLLDKVTVIVASSGAVGDRTNLAFTPLEQDALLPGHVGRHLLQPHHVPELKRLVRTVPASQLGLLIRSGDDDLLQLPGQYVQAAVVQLSNLATNRGSNATGTQQPIQPGEGEKKPPAPEPPTTVKPC